MGKGKEINMDKIILYSNHCPRCEDIKNFLVLANVDFKIEDDNDKMIAMGLNQMPILEINGVRKNYINAIKWLKEREK